MPGSVIWISVDPAVWVIAVPDTREMCIRDSLMPSLFEPCGLSQLMALRYGTVPIVRETGGLKDTVEPYNEFESTGTGFSFANYNAHEMLGSVRYAKHIYYDKRREWNKIIDRAMATDFSWKVSAGKYQELYDWLIG